jgi:hypothetical protein
MFTDETLALIRSNPQVAYVEPDQIVSIGMHKFHKQGHISKNDQTTSFTGANYIRQTGRFELFGGMLRNMILIKFYDPEKTLHGVSPVSPIWKSPPTKKLWPNTSTKTL